MITRRQFLKLGAAAGAGFLLPIPWKTGFVLASTPGGTLNPTDIPKFAQPLIIPPAMPRAGTTAEGGKTVDVYRIAVQQFQQQILPAGLPQTTVWGYGALNQPATFNYPAFTIEALWDRPVRVRWINNLKDGAGNYLPHLLTVDQTLHWANPPGGRAGRDSRGTNPNPYTGPVPMVPHVHGAHTTQESDGYAEAWFLPAAKNLPRGYARVGSWYNTFQEMFRAAHGVGWPAGSSIFQYPNDQRAGTIWYHDHTLGMTRLNVYAGPAGFYLLRGGPDDQVGGRLPGPAPARGDRAGKKYYEIPIAIQDRSFNGDGSLFYPSNRAFFEGLEPGQLQIPFIPDTACDGQPSDISPFWNPEFFGNTMVVNGRAWPYLDVEQRRYRFRLLNGCNSRFLILKLDNGLPFWQIGTEGGFLPAPVQLDRLLLAPAERADVILDFSGVPVGSQIILLNLGPDEPFSGGEPGADFEVADPNTMGVVLQFRVKAATSTDRSTPPHQLQLPAIAPLPGETNTRQVSLNEMMSMSVRTVPDGSGNVRLDCGGSEFGPAAAMLGTLNPDGTGHHLMWDDPITENPALNSTEVWEIYNFTADAHPIHLHEIMFEVVNRQPFAGETRGPEPWEAAFKDTVIAYPGEITRIRAKFDLPGRYVWHCHIVEHEDNEMMRPYDVVG